MKDQPNPSRLGPVAIPRLWAPGTSELTRAELVLQDGRVTEIRATSESTAAPILIPRLVEPHCHLDKTHTIHRMTGIGGDLQSAIDAQRIDKVHWSDEDIRSRARIGLAEMTAAGVGIARSHVDWGDDAPAPRSWSVLLELAQDHPIDLQLSALTGVWQMADKGFARQVADQIPEGHALGAFVRNQLGQADGLCNMFAEAERRGLPLDFHVDEGLDPDLNGLEEIAEMALATGFAGPILCGHACSLSLRDDATVARIADKLARAGITVCALPTTNLYLQGRRNGTPTERGVTLLRDLHAAGVRIALGADNVRDAFCPVGRHDPLRVLETAVIAAHLDPPFDRWIAAVTTDAATALGKPAPAIIGARLDDLLICDATDMAGLIAGARLTPAATFAKDMMQ
ncbi:amidohydrolase family protein [Shimia biformata]|uniref:amidohydrolase family protein n=1 Tax=Shimia biformata TaxID=1294299 RepID=UPI00194E5113|nr:amidohydrolase family protein [Shimia biformata]